MAAAKLEPTVLAHLEWLSFVRPTGLVVSAPALVRAGAILERTDIEGQRRLRESVVERTFVPADGPRACLPNFKTFARTVLDWNFGTATILDASTEPTPAELEVALPEEGLTLRPDFAVREPEPRDGASPWQLIVHVLEPGTDFDLAGHRDGQRDISAHGRMERLLRQSGVAAGLIFNGRALRLVSAPRGESSGWLDFKVEDMLQTAGRPICTAMRLLLRESRLLALPRAERLPSLLEESRKFQNEVSERLAEQVLHALYELLRGFQAAHDASKGELLREVLADRPDEVYRALLTVILRLVFLLFTEERDLLPEDEAFVQFYSLGGLHERLREDAALFPDTMDQRFGAWAQLLVLFRMVHDGASSGAMHLPARHGVLFDPDRFKFLEGRSGMGARQITEGIEPPLVPDGTIFRALEKLLVLDGERISYRALDVEQIGSVYETMMGFRLETATGRSVAIKAAKKHGAPATVDLEALLAVPAAKREKWLQDRTDRKPADRARGAIKAAASLEDLHAALLPMVDLAATPDLVPQGAMVLQPSEERRRSGSHYTPRALTGPIVRTTLEPILARLRATDGQPPRPEQLLDLKVCDPAMGSGAFLVEACRQLGEALVESWRAYGEVPAIPADEDELVLARRMIAQRCIYGVDRNPVAVDLSKVSLWLVTLAREHPLTFLDHALRHGDSLVGLTRQQIESFHWDPDERWESPFRDRMREELRAVEQLRQQIRAAGDNVTDWELRDLWDQAQQALGTVRLYGDLVIAAFFEGEKPKERQRKRDEFRDAVVRGTADRYRVWLEDRRDEDPPLAPFHWEVEFPEVFERERHGFDAIVGNPPFAGHVSLVSANLPGYTDWLRSEHADSAGKADVVAHFFRRSFNLLRLGGAFGLIATNTIAQGDTRGSGLRWIRKHEGNIFAVRKRMKWPGQAAVVVSVVHVAKGVPCGTARLDDREVITITAFLFHRGGDDDPIRLAANSGRSFQGSIVLGMGFTFDDTDAKGIATPLHEMERLIEARAANAEVILPYVGGEEVNTSPSHAPHRYVIDLGERTEEECRRSWPELMSLLEAKVKPERLESARKSKSAHGERAGVWWQHYHHAKDLYAAVEGLDRALVINCGATPHCSFAFLPVGMVFANTLAVFPLTTFAAFCALQSRPHEIWARFFGSSMKDDLRYTPSDCFETFPFPGLWENHPQLEAAGKAYYDFRAALMLRNNEGLTKTYNRFHDPEERSADILTLRELHAAMDRTVLEAYDWSDLQTACEFLLEYEIDEEEWGDRKKPWRYRWPDDVRDEVLARLLELNQKRANDERLAGGASSAESGKGSAKRRRKPTSTASSAEGTQPQGTLFEQSTPGDD
jgi:hypothetical protein